MYINNVYILWLLNVINIVNALECYVCANQSSNTGKCVKTIETCDIDEDRCLSFVRWGGTPYWGPRADKQYYISKTCASKATCEKTKSRTMPRCRRIWYEDWECAECCQGNMCNYFITLGSPSLTSSLSFICIVSSLTIFHSFFW